MSSKCIKRLQQELKDMRVNKASNAEAAPDESDLLTWYYVLEGPKDTPYEGGEYLGRIKIPNNYPFSPPSYFICTPNGRFQTETSICTSFSSYHADQWTPAWNMSTILQGLLSFMVENATTAGSITTDDATKKALAQASHQFNVKQARYRTLFPERYNRALTKVEEMNAEKEKKKKEEAAAALAAQNEKIFAENNSNNDNNSNNNDIPQQLTNNNNNNLLLNNNNQNRNKNNNSGYLENKKVAYLMLAVTVGAAIAAKFL